MLYISSCGVDGHDSFDGIQISKAVHPRLTMVGIWLVGPTCRIDSSECHLWSVGPLLWLLLSRHVVPVSISFPSYFVHVFPLLVFR